MRPLFLSRPVKEKTMKDSTAYRPLILVLFIIAAIIFYAGLIAPRAKGAGRRCASCIPSWIAAPVASLESPAGVVRTPVVQTGAAIQFGYCASCQGGSCSVAFPVQQFAAPGVTSGLGTGNATFTHCQCSSPADCTCPNGGPGGASCLCGECEARKGAVQFAPGQCAAGACESRGLFHRRGRRCR